MGDSEYEEIIEGMNSADHKQRQKAIEEAKGRCPEIIPDLIQYLEKGKNTRSFAIKRGLIHQFLGPIKSFIRYEAAAKDHPWWRFCEAALIVLRDHPDSFDEHSDLLKDLAQDYNPRVCKAANILRR